MRLDDGYETYLYVYKPSAASNKLPVVYVHGIQSHPGWFGGSAAAMARAGHAVYQVARRGSGENTLDRGDTLSSEQQLQDVAAAFQYAQRDSGASRAHLLGVSWGGKLTATYVTRRPKDAAIASLTLVAAGITAEVDVSIFTKLSIAISLLVNPRKKFDIPLSDVELFTNNPAMQAYLRADTRRLTQATARFLYSSRRLDWMLYWVRTSIAVPTTLILASSDRIIDNDATSWEVRELTGGRARVVKLAGSHTLEFEPDPQAYYETLLDGFTRAESGA